ncbi:beta-propeller fold lactonase family protein [Acinetobacter bereziniae]|uniref:YncE family protein n=1 Tax=Acinetobacter bereziniae TaxID=106648 RepID=UPI0021CDCA18|nr:beta-propeller fold lactonase family protein [Acinetobacter bereziniae]MCU4415607.1 beta-propeller fold lactonase family protein [Acinetobacter bereziniae]MCU4539166.1 beta-propeller fold lactonase family protein [Acinetobacter bereziniae]
MKKAILSLSIGMILFASHLAYASTDQENASILDSIAGVPEHSSPDPTDDRALYRAEVERLYPQYIKEDEGDQLYSTFLADYQYRKFWSAYFDRSIQYLDLYQSSIQQEQLRKIDPELSKLDAMLYADLTRIYQSLDQIQNHLKPVVDFNRVIVDQIKFDQPYPLLDEEQGSAYRSALRNMNDVQNAEKKQLVLLAQMIDQYQDRVDEFAKIVSKRVKKQHQKNIDVLNRKVALIGHYLSAQLQGYDAFKATYSVLDSYDAEAHPVYAKKYQHAAQSEQNLKKVNAIMAAIAQEQSPNTASSEAPDQVGALQDSSQYCDYLWNGEERGEIAGYLGKTQQQYIRDCQEQKTKIQQFYKSQVFLEAVPQQTVTLPNMNAMGDFRRYGDDLYYTETEKNAVYRFNLVSFKEELLYQYALADDESGCMHNMCRGVGATDVVLSHDGQIIYVASLDHDQVFAIDLKTKQILQKFKVERYPRKLLLDQQGENLYVYNGVGNSISRIQLKSGKITTAALPANYQEHFCREIDMVFEPDQKSIRILGDWANRPFIYMNTADLSFFELNFDVPQKVLYTVDDYRSVVEFYQDSENQIGIYDQRIADLVSVINVQDESSQDQDEQEDNRYTYRDVYTRSIPVMMGYLADQYFYYAEKANFNRFNSLNSALDQQDLDIYLLNLVEQTQENSQKVAFKLPSKPQHIELLENGKILILFAESYLNDQKILPQALVFDPNDPATQQVFARNKTKRLAQSELKVIKLHQED